MYTRELPPPKQPGMSYRGLTDPLPDPPRGQEWSHDTITREWKLVPTTTTTTSTDDADAADVDGGSRQHRVLTTDTFMGICLKYGITPMSLRRANRMLDDDLKLAPEVLIIPSGDNVANSRRGGKTQSKEEKVASLIFKSKLLKNTTNGRSMELSSSEARAYLEMSDWDVSDAMKSVEEDYSWSGE